VSRRDLSQFFCLLLVAALFCYVLAVDIREKARVESAKYVSDLGLEVAHSDCEWSDPDHDGHVVCRVQVRRSTMVVRCPVWSNRPCSR